MPTEPVVWNHSAHGAFDQQFGMASASCPGIFRFVAADVSGKAHVTFLFLFFPGEPDFFRVDDDHEISSVHMWRENRFFFAPQQVGSLDRDATEHLIVGVDEPPLARHFIGFGRKRFHSWKKSTETTGEAITCQPSLAI